MMNREAPLSHRPGQILRKWLDVAIWRGSYTNRRPNPKAMDKGSRMSRFKIPSLMKRSGLNRSGSGYISGSCNIALEKRLQLEQRTDLPTECIPCILGRVSMMYIGVI